MKRRSFLKSTLLAIAATAGGLRVAEAGIVESKIEGWAEHRLDVTPMRDGSKYYRQFVNQSLVGYGYLP